MSASTELALLPNLGGEEGDRWRKMRTEPAVASAAALWCSLFGRSARVAGSRASPWDEPAFDWLPTDGALAWWGDTSASGDPALAGKRWRGAAPQATEAVHDKAFAAGNGAPPPALRGVSAVFEPDELRCTDEAVPRLQEALARWPADWRRQFCLKPRLGSSGRGRVLGRDGDPDTAAIRGALPRLARCGGAILEPWLDRTRDLSVSFLIGEARDGPPLHLLGSLTSIQRDAGVPLGHHGEIDSRGRIYSGSTFDDALREAGSELALAASERGYRGPCGVDALTFRGPDGADTLRPTVELNARFTMGIVALGCIRRARDELKRQLGVEPGMRAGVVMIYNLPEGDWQRVGADFVLPIRTLARSRDGGGPAILGCRDPERLDAIVADLRDTAGPSTAKPATRED
jgi:hypothetical protein